MVIKAGLPLKVAICGVEWTRTISALSSAWMSALKFDGSSTIWSMPKLAYRHYVPTLRVKCS